MNNNWKDYYEILEVSQTASLDEIKKSYRELIKKYHPDISKEENATERFLEIQEAYDILSDDKKRASYDLNYESNKNGEFQNKDTYEENIDYDEVINEYDKRTRDYAEKMAIKKVIEETISKAEKIIELKNDIILSAYENDITETDYEENLEALIEIYNKYQEELEQLCQKAMEKGLDYLVPNIEQASNKIEEELKGIPLTILDAINYVEDELVGESIKQQINPDITACQQINQKLDDFFNQLGNGIIDEKNYKAYYEKFKLEIKSTMAKLLNMKKLTKLFSMNKEFKIVNKLMTEISTKEISLPETYGEAKITAKVIILNKNISTFSNKVKLYKSTATKAERMLNLNPYDVKGFEEAYLAEKLFEEIKDDYKALKKETDSLEILKNIEVLEDIFISSYDILNQTRKDLKEVKSSTGMFVIVEAKKQYKKNHSVDSKTRNKIAEKTRDILKISEDITKLSSYEELYNKAQAYIDIINCTSSGYMPHKEKLELAYHEGYDCYEHLEDIIMYYENELFDACFHSLSYGEALTKSLFCAAIKLAYTLFIELVVYSIVPRVVLKYLNLFIFCMCLKKILQDILEVRKNKKNGKDYQKTIDSNLVLKKKYDRYLNSR